MIFQSKTKKDFINKINSSLIEKNKNHLETKKKACFERISNNFSNDILIKNIILYGV